MLTTSYRIARAAAPGRATTPYRPVRRLLSVAVTAAAVMPASAAGAAESAPTVRWKAPAGQTADVTTVSGTAVLRADVASDSPVDGWSVTVLGQGEDPAFGVICQDAFKRPRNKFDVECRWDTTRYPDQRPSPNGHYRIRLMTQHGSAVQPAGPDRAVAVNNRPSAPEGVRVSHDEADGKTVVTWTANPEPDIAHYDVEQKVSRREWTRIGQTTGTRFEVAVSEPADHRYRVAAERRNADGVAGGPGRWTSASGSRPPAPDEGSASKQAERSQRRSGEPRPGRDERGEHPGPRRSEPGADQRPGGNQRPATDRPSRTAPTAHPPSAPAGDGKTASTPAEQPPPAERAALAFSPGSTHALTSVHGAPSLRHAPAVATTAAPAPGRQPMPSPTATRPASLPERHTGFDEALPYRSPREPSSLAAPPEEPAVPAEPPPASTPEGRSPVLLRLVGIGLIATSIVVFRKALRPAHRGHRGRRATAAPEAPAAGSVPISTPEDPTSWLTRLEECVTRLEACLRQPQHEEHRRTDAADAA